MEEVVSLGAASMWELSVLSSQFCCEPKTFLKHKIYLIKKFNCCYVPDIVISLESKRCIKHMVMIKIDN